MVTIVTERWNARQPRSGEPRSCRRCLAGAATTTTLHSASSTQHSHVPCPCNSLGRCRAYSSLNRRKQDRRAPCQAAQPVCRELPRGRVCRAVGRCSCRPTISPAAGWSGMPIRGKGGHQGACSVQGGLGDAPAHGPTTTLRKRVGAVRGAGRRRITCSRPARRPSRRCSRSYEAPPGPLLRPAGSSRPRLGLLRLGQRRQVGVERAGAQGAAEEGWAGPAGALRAGERAAWGQAQPCGFPARSRNAVHASGAAALRSTTPDCRCGTAIRSRRRRLRHRALAAACRLPTVRRRVRLPSLQWCGHCKALTPEWGRAAAALKGMLTVAAVDADANKDVAAEVRPLLAAWRRPESDFAASCFGCSWLTQRPSSSPQADERPWVPNHQGEGARRGAAQRRRAAGRAGRRRRAATALAPA